MEEIELTLKPPFNKEEQELVNKIKKWSGPPEVVVLGRTYAITNVTQKSLVRDTTWQGDIYADSFVITGMGIQTL